VSGPEQPSAATTSGKGAAEEVASYLGALPSEQESLAKFVGENLGDEILETLVMAAEATWPAAEAVLMLSRVSQLRRFQMGWMMAGSKAKAAAQRVFKAAAAKPPAALGTNGLAAVAKEYDCKL